jgi:hypothetical protein
MLELILIISNTVIGTIGAFFMYRSKGMNKTSAVMNALSNMIMTWRNRVAGGAVLPSLADFVETTADMAKQRTLSGEERAAIISAYHALDARFQNGVK